MILQNKSKMWIYLLSLHVSNCFYLKTDFLKNSFNTEPFVTTLSEGGVMWLSGIYTIFILCTLYIEKGSAPALSIHQSIDYCDICNIYILSVCCSVVHMYGTSKCQMGFKHILIYSTHVLSPLKSLGTKDKPSTTLNHTVSTHIKVLEENTCIYS